MICIAIVVLASAAEVPVVEIVADTDCVYEVNGHREVHDMLFGWTAYEGAPTPATDRREALRQAGVSCLGFPGPLRWCSPPEGETDNIPGWYASEKALHEITDAEPLNGARYMYGKILPACRDLGIVPMMYLLDGPSWAMGPEQIPLDNAQYAELATGYVGLLKRIDPEMKWLHLDNEPNAHWFRAGKNGKAYGEVFRAVAEAVHEAYPDVMLGGPVLCWPPAWPPAQEGHSNWYTWESWTKPFLDAAGEQVDFFDFHDYDNTPDITLEEVTTIANELRIRRGKEMPILITECGIRLTEEEWRDPLVHWRKRTVPWARYLLALLEHPDKVYSAQMHDLSASASGWFRIVGEAPEYTPTYWLYWVFRHLRGDRIPVKTRRSIGLRTFATRTDDEAALLVFNDGDKVFRVEVGFVGPDGAGGVVWDRLQASTNGKGIAHDTGVGNALTLGPHGIACFHLTSMKLPEPKRMIERLEFFGTTVMNEFEGEEVVVEVVLAKEALRQATSARVRVGTLGNAPGERLRMVLDGERYDLEDDTYFQEVALRGVPEPGVKQLEFHCDSQADVVNARPGDHRLRVSSATIVIERNQGRNHD